MPSSKELLSAPPTASATGELTYLGVEKGYAARTPTGETKPPLYAEGAQYDPNGLSPEIRAQMQVQMDAAGLYKKGDQIRVGVWDETSVEAYTRLLKFANQGGRTVSEALKELGTLSPAERAQAGLGKVGQGGAGGGSGANPLVVNLSNPNDLRTLVDRTARSTLGRAISEAEMQRFITAYQDQQRKEEAATHAANETGGTVVEAPDPGVAATQFVENLDPVAAEAARQVSAFKVISGALSGLRG